jgi:hypothetical protein
MNQVKQSIEESAFMPVDGDGKEWLSDEDVNEDAK